MNEPVYVLELPQSVAMLCATLLRRLPLEQAEQPYGVLMAQIEQAETRRVLREREQLFDEEMARRKAEPPGE